jgi:hypothetical protein
MLFLNKTKTVENSVVLSQEKNILLQKKRIKHIIQLYTLGCIKEDKKKLKTLLVVVDES